MKTPVLFLVLAGALLADYAPQYDPNSIGAWACDATHPGFAGANGGSYCDDWAYVLPLLKSILVNAGASTTALSNLVTTYLNPYIGTPQGHNFTTDMNSTCTYGNGTRPNLYWWSCANWAP